MRPLVLISNDDGIEAPYLKALASALEELDVEVLVVAPERERSAVSHSITLHKPLRAMDRGPNRIAVSGSPVDCVYIAILKLTDRLPDLVISGINDGFNLGSDVFYSGTVAAAVEGAIRGVPAVAMSMDRAKDADIGAGVRFGVSLASQMLGADIPRNTLLNVNFPATPGDRYRWTSLGKRVYSDDVEMRLDPRGKRYFWIGGGAVDSPQAPGSDCQAVAEGVISVTPLKLDLTAHDQIATAPLAGIDGYAFAGV